MRASYDTLFAKAKGVLSQDPFSGHLFLFVNSSRTSLKCLFYDGTGFVILAKRLERGRFGQFSTRITSDIILTAAEFALYFEGADIEKRIVSRPMSIPFVESPQAENKRFSCAV